jgi:hypothetical protein
MTESTIDMDRAMQGIDCEVITWTKCSERMPPRTYKEKVILIGHQDKNLMYMTAEDCNLLLPAYDYEKKHNCEWTPYTPEAWNSLDRKSN